MPGVYRFDANSNATGTDLTGLNYTSGGYTFAFWATGPFATAGGDVFRHASTANAARSGYALAFSSSSFQVQHFLAASNASHVLALPPVYRQRVWTHYAATWNGSALCGYVNGAQVARVAVTGGPAASATCTTTLLPGIYATYVGLLFDLQIILGAAMPEQDIRLLMNPTYNHPSLKGRYFGREFRGVGASSTLRDESGNGNNLTTGASGRLDIAEEPPIRPTFA